VTDRARFDVILRAMRPDELDQALDIWVAAWQAAYASIDFAARRSWMTRRLAQHRREGAHCLVATAGGRLVGLLVINARTRYLDQIAVDPDRQRAGVGDMLLAEAQRLAPEGFSLHVNQDNTRAIRFYEKHGLTTVGEDVNPRSGAAIFHMRWQP
jgi:ribosomal protein S18 acetylase RimI-like enzyme